MRSQIKTFKNLFVMSAAPGSEFPASEFRTGFWILMQSKKNIWHLLRLPLCYIGRSRFWIYRVSLNFRNKIHWSLTFLTRKGVTFLLNIWSSPNFYARCKTSYHSKNLDNGRNFPWKICHLWGGTSVLLQGCVCDTDWIFAQQHRACEHPLKWTEYLLWW